MHDIIFEPKYCGLFEMKPSSIATFVIRYQDAVKDLKLHPENMANMRLSGGSMRSPSAPPNIFKHALICGTVFIYKNSLSTGTIAPIIPSSCMLTAES